MVRIGAFVLGIISLAVIGRADTIYTVSLTTDDCTGGCLVGTNYPTITLDDNNSGTVQITETLPSYMIYATSGAGDALAFNLLNPTAALTVNVLTTGFTYEGASTYHDDGTGDFTNAIDCTGCGSGTTAPQLSGPLVFTISGSGFSVADFIANTPNGNYFSSDVGSVLTGGTGKTGDVAGNTIQQCTGQDCGGNPQSLSPEPFTLWLTGAGLIALGLVRKRWLA